MKLKKERKTVGTESRKKTTRKLTIPKELSEAVALPPRPKDMEAHEERKLIFELKGKVWEFERNNLQYIVFYHRDHQWWQCGDNSMLIYYYLVAKQLGLRNLQIRHDNDYSAKKWQFGYITVGKIDKLMGNLIALDYECLADASEIKIFALPNPMSLEDMEVWRNAENEKEKRFNALVVPKNIYPKVLSKAAILHREVVNKVVNLSPARQHHYGDMGAELTTWIAYNSIAMANGRMEPEEFFAGTLTRLEQLNDWMAFVKKFNLFNIDTDLRILQEIGELRSLVNTEASIRRKKTQGAGTQDVN